MTHGLLFSNSLVMHHSFQMTSGLLFPNLINYASPPSSNDHGPFVSSHSKEHLLYCFIIYKSKHVQTKKKIFRWKYIKPCREYPNDRFLASRVTACFTKSIMCLGTIDQVFLSSGDVIRTIGDAMISSSSIVMKTIDQVLLSSGDAIRTIGDAMISSSSICYENNRRGAPFKWWRYQNNRERYDIIQLHCYENNRPGAPFKWWRYQNNRGRYDIIQLHMLWEQ